MKLRKRFVLSGMLVFVNAKKIAENTIQRKIAVKLHVTGKYVEAECFIDVG